MHTFRIYTSSKFVSIIGGHTVRRIAVFGLHVPFPSYRLPFALRCLVFGIYEVRSNLTAFVLATTC